MFEKILIANRGEIACRITRTAQSMGIKVVAVYSEADVSAMHVEMADEAVLIGGAAVGDSYLCGDRIIAAALEQGAEAIHPGYGFLSENPEFVEAVEAAGLVFIGPSSQAIRAMGLKDAAKALMQAAGVPVVPGYHGPDQDAAVLADEAGKIGYPVLIKAVAGGGGKGMKIVRREEEFETLFSTAKSEAQKYFGNDEIYIEKFFQNPRHIEVQVLSGKNRTVHLHERDCSVQRRHQKLIEETPSPVLTDQIRKDLFERTVNMVSKIGYEGAGTVEFIYEDGKFYFLEMNTRVQVEHPVTEMVTGIDIIKEQIFIAFSGETALKQSDINPRGHAIECRINAEDASKNFHPSPGTIGMCHQPSGFRTRVDGSIFQGYKVTPYYDSMVCKVITHGRNRTEAIQRMNRSLDEFVIEGITTTIPLHKILLSHKKFIKSDFNVSWLDNEKLI